MRATRLTLPNSRDGNGGHHYATANYTSRSSVGGRGLGRRPKVRIPVCAWLRAEWGGCTGESLVGVRNRRSVEASPYAEPGELLLRGDRSLRRTFRTDTRAANGRRAASDTGRQLGG